MGNILDNDIKFIHGVGEQRAKMLDKELGIRTFGDMLYYFPFRYVDRTPLLPHLRNHRGAEPDPGPVSRPNHRLRPCRFGTQGSLLGLRVGRHGIGRADLVQGHKVDRKASSDRCRIYHLRPSELLRGELSIVHPEIEPVMSARKRPDGLQGIYSHHRTSDQPPARQQGDLQYHLRTLAAGRETYHRPPA